MIVNAPDLYRYLDYRQWLSDWFTWKKQVNPRYSHRAFARRAGQSSPSLLLNVVARRRNLTPATAAGVARATDLTEEQATFFRALVELDQADSPEGRAAALSDVRAARRFREARKLDGDAVEYLSCWYYPAVRELATCRGFRPDPEWIAAELRPRVTVAQAARALELLVSLGLLVVEDGVARVTDVSLATPHEVAAVAAYAYHREMLERATEALQTAAPSERHFCAVTVAVPDALVPTLKRELDALQERLLDLCDGAEAPRDRVYQVNLHLLPLSARGAEP